MMRSKNNSAYFADNIKNAHKCHICAQFIATVSECVIIAPKFSNHSYTDKISKR